MDLSCIQRSAISDGEFYVQYQNPGKKPKMKRVGLVDEIPNIHIVQTFIDTINKR